MADKVTLTYQDLFASREQQQVAINNLKGLEAHPGWVLFRKILDINIKTREDQILSNPELDKEEEKELKLERLLFIFIRDLPHELQLQLVAEAQQVTHSDDPYE